MRLETLGLGRKVGDIKPNVQKGEKTVSEKGLGCKAKFLDVELLPEKEGMARVRLVRQKKKGKVRVTGC